MKNSNSKDRPPYPRLGRRENCRPKRVLETVCAQLPIPAILMSAGEDPKVETVNGRFLRTFGQQYLSIPPLSALNRLLCADSEGKQEMREWWARSSRRLSSSTGIVLSKKFRATVRSGRRLEVLVSLTMASGMLMATFRACLGNRARLPLLSPNSLGEQNPPRLCPKTESIIDALTDPHMILEPVPKGSRHPEDFVVLHANPPACLYWGVPLERAKGKVLRRSPLHSTPAELWLGREMSWQPASPWS